MPKRRSTMVWVKLRIGEEEAAFAESQWRKLSYFSRDDYLNALLNSALMKEMPPKPYDPSKVRLYTGMDDDLPF